MAKILVIDDDDNVRFSLLSVLRTIGHEVEGAINGEDGVAKCAQETYDVVFCDLIMPVKNGIDTILELKAEYPGIKIVAMSGGGQNLDAQGMRDKTGADIALIKPFSFTELNDCLATMLA